MEILYLSLIFLGISYLILLLHEIKRAVSGLDVIFREILKCIKPDIDGKYYIGDHFKKVKDENKGEL